MPLQKSFSEQNHSAKSKGSRQQWNRNRSYAGPPTGNTNVPSKPLQEKPPIPVSTATKTKLSVFQFSGNDSGKMDKPVTVINLISSDEQENEMVTPKKPAKQDKGELRNEAGNTAEEEGEDAEDQTLLPEIPRKAVPKTPAGRLALPDLIAMGDMKKAVQDISPEERVGWDHDRDMIHSSASSYGGIRRARKRARSSSPTNKSPGRSSPRFQGEFYSLNTHIDPGSELWGRYSLYGSNAPTPQGQSITPFANIMHTSSPQPKEITPRSIAGFRRTSSCGNQFPKRRRVGGGPNDIFTEQANIGPSKLSVLIERVQEGLTLPRTSRTPGGSFGSSQTVSRTSSIVTKPVEEEQEVHPVPTVIPVSEAMDTLHMPRNADQPTDQPMHVVTSSDYGEFDEDIDESLFEVLEATQPIHVLNSKERQQPNVFSNPPREKSYPTLTPNPPISTTHKAERSAVKDDEDEFDDSDEDMFSAGLAQMAARLDDPSTKREISKGRPAEHQPSTKVPSVESDDEFGDDGLDDVELAAVEATATQSIQQSTIGILPPTRSQAIQRYLVTTIVDSEYDSGKGRMQKEKVLLLKVDQRQTTKVLHLRGAWLETLVTTKAFVHVIGVFDADGVCIIDDNHNILILHPDHLISSTVVADSFGCTRRAVLQDRVKATSDSSAPLVYGTILHEIFQAAMLANRWDTEWLTDTINGIATSHLEDLYTIKVEIPHAVQYLLSKMTELQCWAELFVAAQPKPDAFVQAGNGTKANMCVSKLLDVEEHVWSPMYGLKGNIDATVQVTMKEGKETRTLTVPFEVKTGKNPTAAHRAQTTLYNLLLSDRYGIEIAYGILYYMETSATIRLPTIRRELLHMIIQRNKLACFVRERQDQLPSMLKKESMCNRCYAKVPCFIYHKFADDGNGETSGVNDKFDEVVKHLTPNHKEFFLKWDNLLTKEEKESLKFRRELWTMLSGERENLGRCFSNVIIEPGSAFEDQNNPKINRYKYNLIKENPVKGFSFVGSEIIVGEPIVISDEEGHYALANGYVTQVRKQRITVAVDRRLHNARIRQPGFDKTDNQVFASIMEVAPEGSTAQEAEGKIIDQPIKYRLDKDEFSNGMATVRNNLIDIMVDGTFGSRELRSLIVDLNPPRFKTQSTAYVLKDRENINIDQRRAIQKVMSAQDYALVLGMPGTGKTTTIIHIIRALVAQGKSVLLTSYTHSAVDNILLKLKDDDIPILRIGAIAKIHPDVQEFATLASTKKTSFEEIRSAWHDTPIVATTCLAINHPIFRERTFDYCIVDEASQITLPVCIGPIRMARTFILVGDHNQLPPLVQNEEARTGGLDISLFKLLSDTHPDSVVYLEHQYRMCEDVMALSNNLIYQGRLKCGSAEVAKRTLSIPDMAGLQNHHFSPSTLSRSQKSICAGPVIARCWIHDLTEPDVKVAFVNTDPLLPASREEAKGNRIVNPTEAAICIQLVESFLSVGVPASSIGVMTHYRSQLNLLKDGLRAHKGVEMHTADRFQGRDKEIIILSLVRSNETKSIGELLKDWRRINVAFTRAKSKLLVIGSQSTLKGNGPNVNGEVEMVAKFVNLMEEKEWIYDLPNGALVEHLFEDAPTQATASARNIPPSHSKAGEQNGLKRKATVLAVGDENKLNMTKKAGLAASKRMPNKKIFGNKPFKIPQMSVLRDVVNENSF